MGSSFHRKVVDQAIRAMAFLRDSVASGPKFKLVIIGDDNESSYINLAQKLQISDCLQFMHSPMDASAIIVAADVLIHSARSENTGTVIVEALTLGVPVICSATCGFAHYVTDLESGIVVDAKPSQPFQEVLNEACFEILSLDVCDRLKRGACCYSEDRSKIPMAEAAVSWLEQFFVVQIYVVHISSANS